MKAEKRRPLYQSSMLGISMKFETVPGGYNPPHYHDELEILFPLNGDMDLAIDGKKQRLEKNKLTVIESGSIHQTFTHDRYCMLAVIHVSRKYLLSYLPNIELYRINCSPYDIPEEKEVLYVKICLMLADLIRLYMMDAPMFELEADGIMLQVLAMLLRDFSVVATPQLPEASVAAVERMQTVITYVQEHYMESIGLEEVTALLGINRSYFCRYFKQSMGKSFLTYLNEVRLVHAYQDLLETDLPVAEIMEKNGLTNQKLFNRTFKELYGCTPTQTRKDL